MKFDYFDVVIEPKPVGLLADLPALAKAINMIQYNGYFSCVHCMVEGERIGNTMSFKYSKITRVNKL